MRQLVWCAVLFLATACQVQTAGGDWVDVVGAEKSELSGPRDFEAEKPKRICVGGDLDGQACSDNDDCYGLCWGGPFDKDVCTSNYDCNSYCRAGTDFCADDPSQECGDDKPCPKKCAQSGESCSSDVDCGLSCNDGIKTGQSCENSGDCPGECSGGRNHGELCNSDSDCAGTCNGGWQQGDVACSDDNDCSGGCEHDGSFCLNHDDCDVVDPNSGLIIEGCCHADGQCEDAGKCINNGACTANDTCGSGACVNDFIFCLGRGTCMDADDVGEETL
ncbi:MAG: hypothetical protein AAFY60_08290 [Myxococcota bacterium]